jgi:mRNA interferase MazF
MRRGDIWAVASGGGYAAKPRPAVIVQEDSFAATNSITLCVFTTDDVALPLFRMPVEPTELNGLQLACHLMVDKITTVPRAKVGARIGRLDDAQILKLNQMLMVFLGLGASPAKRRPA